jgi:hypothetical protein
VALARYDSNDMFDIAEKSSLQDSRLVVAPYIIPSGESIVTLG